MCINKEGQFQTYFGFIKKNIDANKQKLLTTFSEPQKAKISAEFYRVTINGEWLNTMPFNRILSNCLKEINIPWKNKFNETLILSPEEDDIPARLEQPGEVDAVPLAAGKVGDPLLLVSALEVEPGDVLARVHLALAQRHDVGRLESPRRTGAEGRHGPRSQPGCTQTESGIGQEFASLHGVTSMWQ